MIFNERVTSITQDKFIPNVVDQINNSNVLTCRILSKPKPWSGETVKQPSQYANSTTGGSFSGMDTFQTSATSTVKTMSWNVKAFYQSLVIPGIEKAVNAVSETKVLSLVAQKMDEAKNSAINSIGTLMYSTGLGDDIEGLGLIVDDGTATSSYGGLTRSTNTWVNAQLSASGGTITLDNMATVHDNCSAAGSESESPNLMVTTKSVWTFYESLLNPTVTANYNAEGYPMVNGSTAPGTVQKSNGLGGRGGFRALTFRGLPVVADDKCTSQTLFFLNERYLEFQSLKSPDLKQISMANEVTVGVYSEKATPTAFQMKDLQMPTNQFGEVGQLILMGNFIARQPRRNGKLTGITTA